MTVSTQIIFSNKHADILYKDYFKIFDLTRAPLSISIGDHLGGFDKNYYNHILEHLNKVSTGTCAVWNNQIFDNNLTSKYPNLQFNVLFPLWLWNQFSHYQIHPAVKYKNFICSFNGSPHVSRKLLVAILQKFGYFNNTHCSKNFTYSIDVLDGHLEDYVSNSNFHRKFFISNASEDFFQTKYSFGHNRFNHTDNIYSLESKLTESFIHIVSETMSTSYVPFITEKFLYSVATRGLFLTYGQPGWHEHIEKYYGFKKYTKLFDYRFDSIKNPVERLVELITMISKFSKLSPTEWHDLYLIELDTIEYNHDHYFSGSYLKHLWQYKN